MNDELVTVATSDHVVEAEFLRNHLEQQGFDVFLADENIVGAYNLLANAVGGIKIKVPSSEAPAAASFIENLRNAVIIEEEFETVDNGYGECGSCRSRDLFLQWDKMGIKGYFSFLGVQTAAPKLKLHCRVCGAAWNYE
ncbi:MAG: DUF2007 domain-containing protein [Acidobacteria bacterium]|nr:DUF2007 domain-containing protein [Acidobacteriota bacterium]